MSWERDQSPTFDRQPQCWRTEELTFSQRPPILPLSCSLGGLKFGPVDADWLCGTASAIAITSLLLSTGLVLDPPKQNQACPLFRPTSSLTYHAPFDGDHSFEFASVSASSSSGAAADRAWPAPRTIHRFAGSLAGLRVHGDHTSIARTKARC